MMNPLLRELVEKSRDRDREALRYFLVSNGIYRRELHEVAKMLIEIRAHDLGIRVDPILREDVFWEVSDLDLDEDYDYANSMCEEREQALESSNVSENTYMPTDKWAALSAELLTASKDAADPVTQIHYVLAEYGIMPESCREDCENLN